MKYTFGALRAEYEELWADVVVDADRRHEVEALAARIIAHRDSYEPIAERTGVPWFVVGILHAMEAGLDFRCHLHNGDRLTHRTRQVPAGRPPAPLEPPFSFQDSACDALAYDGLDEVRDWSPERLAYEAEKYNGWGYRGRRNIPSPYLWSYTCHEVPGKFTSDSVWDPSARSRQPGAMALLRVLMDRGITFERASQPAIRKPAPAAAPKPDATLEHIRPLSRKLTWLERARVFLGLGGAGAAPLSMVALVNQGKELSDALSSVTSSPLLLVVVGACALGLVAAVVLEQLHLDDYRAGRWTPSGAAGDPGQPSG